MKNLGLVAYLAYGEVVEWKNYQGNPMPQWDDLSDRIREAWSAAAVAVAAAAAGVARHE